MSRNILSKNISEIFSKVFFVTLYVLLIVEIFAILQKSSILFPSILVGTIFFLVTLFSSFWGIWLFVAFVPLMNGFLLTKGVGDLSMAFAGVYLAWLPQQFTKNKKFHPASSTVFFVNLLVSIVFLNLVMVLVRIGEIPIPSRAWLAWFAYFPHVGQNDNLWSINASLVLLKGLLLFKMLDRELRDRISWVVFSKVIYVHVIFIVGFSLAQLIKFKIRGENYLGIYLPFNDIHSYGSYAVLLLVVFTAFFLKGIGTRRIGHEYQSGEKIKKIQPVFFGFDSPKIAHFFYTLSSKTMINGLLAVSFLFLCCYSSSRMTWLAMGVILVCLVVNSIKNKLLVICLGGVIVLAIIAGSLSVPQLLQSDNPSLSRLGSVLDITNFNKDESLRIRFELWKRALKMVQDYPLTGVGLGNFYKTNVHYKNISMDQWDAENAHNYYLQLLAELGIPGLLLFLAILLSLYLRRITAVGGEGDLPPEFSVKPFYYGLGAYLVTMLTGHPLLLSSQQFLFWAIVAIVLKGQVFVLDDDGRITPASKISRIIGFFIFLLFVFGFSKNLYKQEPRILPVEYGLYSIENMDGAKMRWMAGKAEYYLPEMTRELKLKVMAQPFNSQKPEGLTLKISINDSVVDNVRFIEGGTKHLRYDIRSANKQDIKVNLEVDNIFCPKDIGLNDDFRVLGVALGLDG